MDRCNSLVSHRRALCDTLNSRTMHTKRTQRILWAAGETALPKAIQPRYLVSAGGDGVSVPESETKGSLMCEILEGLSGSESVARRKRSVRNLGGPMVSLKSGTVYQRNSRRTPDGPWGVRSLHSTLRR